MKKIVLICIYICLAPSILSAKREHPEKWYQKDWCAAHKGQMEVVLPDGTRCDCLTDSLAIEFDFGINWGEAVGQSTYYALQTEKKTGNSPDFRSVKRKEILVPIEYDYRSLKIADRHMEYWKCIVLEI
jgi:hypothetical protein